MHFFYSLAKFAPEANKKLLLILLDSLLNIKIIVSNIDEG